MIPKILHFCWFGKGEYPELTQKCIASWNKYLPDWEYKLWNEDNFDVNSHPYTKEAYEAKKYAFVADYVRLWALIQYGGVYFDTDAEVIKPMDDLLDLPGFVCYENHGDKNLFTISTAVIGANKNNTWAKEMFEDYSDRHFIDSKGKYDLTPNTQYPAKKMVQEGFQYSPDFPTRIYKDCMYVFNPHYFDCYMAANKLEVTEESYVIHHYMNSWMDPVPKWKRIYRKLTRPLRNIVKKVIRYL